MNFRENTYFSTSCQVSNLSTPELTATATLPGAARNRLVLKTKRHITNFQTVVKHIFKRRYKTSGDWTLIAIPLLTLITTTSATSTGCKLADE